jgi:antirestriction protein ArdC
MTTDRREDVLNRLTEGITRLTTSDAWKEWLDVQTRFHRYSFNNSLLIQLQRPDATRVAGFHAWRRLGRNVRRGEKAIWILAPVTRKVDDEASADAPADERGCVLVAFKPTAVFDIAQTDGEELPEVVTRLQGDDLTGAYSRLVTVARGLGFTVEEDYLNGSMNGCCSFDEHCIRIEARNDELQQVKTLAHEIAHAMLHEHATNRPIAELEAESVAYAVCHALGIESGDYSFGYVTTWAGGGVEAVSAIKAAGARIQRTANDILSRLDAGEVASEEAA